MKKTSPFFLVVALALIACRLFASPNSPAIQPSPVIETSPPATQTSTPPTNPTLDPGLSGELQATLIAALPPTATPDGTGFGGIESVAVFPLEVPAGSPPLWAAYSQGNRLIEPLQDHFLAIYTRDSTGWKELSRLDLKDPDYLSEASARQVQVGPPNVWLQVEGGIGAHGGCYSLIRYDGRTLQKVLSNCTDTPLAGELRDLNGDGVPEALLNRSDNYVFCYACGVRIWDYQVWRWDGSQMSEVQLNRLPQPASEELTQLNDGAAALAEAGLWKDAHETIQKAVQMDPNDETVAWNAAVIGVIAEARAKAAQGSDSPYPLLENIFYGDYAAALDLVRPYTPAQIFDPGSPLVAGTVAEGWESNLKDYMKNFTDQALRARPDLAAAYFFRAWATHLVNPADPSVLSDLEQAAQLDPAEPLYSSSLNYLK